MCDGWSDSLPQDVFLKANGPKERLAAISRRQMARYRGELDGAKDEVEVELRLAGGDVEKAARALGMAPDGLRARLAFQRHRR